jgi:hypothetical protein
VKTNWSRGNIKLVAFLGIFGAALQSVAGLNFRFDLGLHGEDLTGPVDQAHQFVTIPIISKDGPRFKVLMKTETGHTILADDRDGDELMRLIDRAGQILTMEAKVKPEIPIRLRGAR